MPITLTGVYRVLEPDTLDALGETPPAPHLGSLRPCGLSLASLVVGAAALMTAIAPSAIWHEPPVWWRWVGLSGRSGPDASGVAGRGDSRERDAGDRPRFEFRVGEVSVGFGKSRETSPDSRATEGASSGEAQKGDPPGGPRDQKAAPAASNAGGGGTAATAPPVWFVRALAAGLALLGITLGVAAWVRRESRGISKAGVILSALALTWEIVLLGVLIAVVIAALGNM